MAVSNKTVMNKVAAYNSRVGYTEVTDANINQVINKILADPEGYANEFIKTMLNVFIPGIIKSSKFVDQYAVARRGMLNEGYGGGLYDVFVNAATPINFKELEPEKALARYYSDIEANYYVINRDTNGFAHTISFVELKKAFYNETGLNDLLAAKSAALRAGDLKEETVIFRNLLSDTDSNGAFPVNVPAVTKANADEIVAIIRENAYNLVNTTENTYNFAMVDNATPFEDQILYISNKAEATLGVYSLAHAFNMSEVDYLQRRVLVNRFADENTIAILTSKDYLFQYDTTYQITTQYNAMKNWWSYFLHHYGIYASSSFENAIRFTTAEVTAPTLTVTGAGELAKGSQSQYTVTSTGYNAHKWSITGANDPDTYITSNGLLHVSTAETSTAIYVTATPPVGTAGTVSVTIS